MEDFFLRRKSALNPGFTGAAKGLQTPAGVPGLHVINHHHQDKQAA